MNIALDNLQLNINNAPIEMQTELFAMQTMSVEELLKIARSQVPETQRQLHLELLEKNQADTITSEERFKLRDLRLVADRLMLRKTYAWAVLSWRGYAVPALDELPEA